MEKWKQHSLKLAAGFLKSQDSLEVAGEGHSCQDDDDDDGEHPGFDFNFYQVLCRILGCWDHWHLWADAISSGNGPALLQGGILGL